MVKIVVIVAAVVTTSWWVTQSPQFGLGLSTSAPEGNLIDGSGN
ncbi:hypothetical protein M2280_005402 [Prescottella agglutinans]|uniref:Uncharacterized protein n=1 Tax=Prescottella agglutinans TaxID=1644129 RepID=A0ABT6MJQ5_9NOCA|nr:hypothetical protein [Prescottella agglutinans]